METGRFETFADAVLAIIMTVLILKIPQPVTPTLVDIFELRTMYIAYFISFLIIFNIWYSNHNLFQLVDEIDNLVVWLYGILLFFVSIIPYFTIWLGRNIYSVPAETCFGLIFIITHFLHVLSVRAVFRSDSYNKKLLESDYLNKKTSIPLIVILIGFLLTYTIFTPGIYITCMISVILWIIIARINRTQGDKL